MCAEKRKELLNFLITFMLICTSGVVQFTFIWNSQSIICLFFISVCLFVFKNDWKMSKRKMIKMLLLAFIIVVNLMVYSNNPDGHISLLLVMISGCILSQFIDWKLFSRYYVNIMAVICIISLVCFAFFVVNPMTIMNKIPIVKYWSIESRYALVYNFPGNQYLIRNFGPYHEGGMFAIFVALAILLLLEQERTNAKQKIYVILFAITIVTTFSTSGILLMLIIFVGKIGKKVTKLHVNIRTIIIAIIGIGFIVWEESTYGIISNKFEAGNASFVARNLEWNILFDQIWNKPFLGVGYQNNQLIKQYGLADGTNGIASVFLQFGLVGGFGILGAYLDGFASFSSKWENKLLYFILAFISFASEPTIFQPLFLCFLFGKSSEGLMNVHTDNKAD